jgi:hypothetical protein
VQHGAILFRGFPVDTPELLDKFVDAFGFDYFPYVGGAAPRRQLAPKVFTTNEAPPTEKIPFHHEMAQGAACDTCTHTHVHAHGLASCW